MLPSITSSPRTCPLVQSWNMWSRDLKLSLQSSIFKMHFTPEVFMKTATSDWHWCSKKHSVGHSPPHLHVPFRNYLLPLPYANPPWCSTWLLTKSNQVPPLSLTPSSSDHPRPAECSRPSSLLCESQSQVFYKALVLHDLSFLTKVIQTQYEMWLFEGFLL